MIFRIRLLIILDNEVEKAVPVRNVRSVANNYTVFANETFIDEISAELNQDP